MLSLATNWNEQIQGIHIYKLRRTATEIRMIMWLTLHLGCNNLSTCSSNTGCMPNSNCRRTIPLLQHYRRRCKYLTTPRGLHRFQTSGSPLLDHHGWIEDACNIDNVFVLGFLCNMVQSWHHQVMNGTHWVYGYRACLAWLDEWLAKID